jgi:DNA-binding response OmpR family regulator
VFVEFVAGQPFRAARSRWVLVVVDDVSLGELLAETLLEAGHVAQLARPEELLEEEIDGGTFEVAIIDLNLPVHVGAKLVTKVRREAPATAVIALLPCGATAEEFNGMHYHLAIETPARLRTVLTAVDAAQCEERE